MTFSSTSFQPKIGSELPHDLGYEVYDEADVARLTRKNPKVITEVWYQ